MEIINTKRIKILILLFSLAQCVLSEDKNQTKPTKHSPHTANTTHLHESTSDMDEFRDVMFDYVNDVLHRDKISILPGVSIEKKKLNYTVAEEKSLGGANLISTIRHFTNSHVVTVNLARAATETGRLFFFKGRK